MLSLVTLHAFLTDSLLGFLSSHLTDLLTFFTCFLYLPCSLFGYLAGLVPASPQRYGADLLTFFFDLLSFLSQEKVH